MGIGLLICRWFSRRWSDQPEMASVVLGALATVTCLPVFAFGSLVFTGWPHVMGAVAVHLAAVARALGHKGTAGLFGSGLGLLALALGSFFLVTSG